MPTLGIAPGKTDWLFLQVKACAIVSSRVSQDSLLGSLAYTTLFQDVKLLFKGVPIIRRLRGCNLKICTEVNMATDAFASPNYTLDEKL